MLRLRVVRWMLTRATVHNQTGAPGERILPVMPSSRLVEIDHWGASQQGVADEQRRQAEPYEVRLALVGLRSPNYRNVGCVRRLIIT